jgi:predicted ATPase
MEELMRRLTLAAVLFSIAAFAHSQVHNIAQSFADFYDANKDKPDAELLALAKLECQGAHALVAATVHALNAARGPSL